MGNSCNCLIDESKTGVEVAKRKDPVQKSMQEVSYKEAIKFEEYIPYMPLSSEARDTWRQLPPFNYPQDNNPGDFIINTEQQDGTLFTGSQLNGMPNGNGVQVLQDGGMCQGTWIDSKLQGKARKIQKNGDYFEGQVVDGMANGQGVFVKQDGSKLQGIWKDNKLNGKGTETWSDGSYYEGQFIDGSKQGYGIFKWIDGNSYEGEFYNNQMHGKGIYSWSNGNQYSGYWENGVMHGKGRLYNAKTDKVTKGVWNQGKRRRR